MNYQLPWCQPVLNLYEYYIAFGALGHIVSVAYLTDKDTAAMYGTGISCVIVVERLKRHIHSIF